MFSLKFINLDYVGFHFVVDAKRARAHVFFINLFCVFLSITVYYYRRRFGVLTIDFGIWVRWIYFCVVNRPAARFHWLISYECTTYVYVNVPVALSVSLSHSDVCWMDAILYILFRVCPHLSIDWLDFALLSFFLFQICLLFVYFSFSLFLFHVRCPFVIFCMRYNAESIIGISIYFFDG